MLFGQEFISQLDALTLLTKHSFVGPTSGQRRSASIGTSVEFSDYRSYSRGDDFRRIDWNAYARLERLFLRLYRAEENISVTFFLDTSKSMNWGSPIKSHLARQIAGALAYVALSNYDRVGIAGFSDRLSPIMAPVSGKQAVWGVWRFLEALPDNGETDLNVALRQFARYRSSAGLSFVLSDLLSGSGYREGLKALAGMRQEVTLIQILAQEEIQPNFAGEWRLIDDESGLPLEVTINARVLKAYRSRFLAFSREVAEFCHRQGISYLQLPSHLPVQDVVLRVMRRQKLLR